MSDLSLRLSAYLDGELDADAMAEIEAILDSDPAAQDELDRLMQADAEIDRQFAEALETPVPMDLARSVREMPMAPAPANRPSAPQRRAPLWAQLAAAVALFAVGLGGGYAWRDFGAVGQGGWLQDIAAYHGLYASQSRHLVEVAASEADHIEQWLGKTVGVNFRIPDLAAQGLEFAGARLVVAAGQPVAQLMYRADDGEVIALCLKDGAGAGGFDQHQIDGFTFVSWSQGGASYVVIGPEDRNDLPQIARAAAVEV